MRLRCVGLFVCLCVCVCVCMCVIQSAGLCCRGVGGKAVVWQVSGGTPEYQWERDRLSHRSLCHHAVGVRHARGGRYRHTHTAEIKEKIIHITQQHFRLISTFFVVSMLCQSLSILLLLGNRGRHCGSVVSTVAILQISLCAVYVTSKVPLNLAIMHTHARGQMQSCIKYPQAKLE